MRNKTNPVVHCDYCNRRAVFTDSAVVYSGRSYGNIYYCKPCKAWVGVHKGTRHPLGRLANAELRKAKMKAHAAFDPLWKDGDMNRAQAYEWLADALGIPAARCHIGMFDVETCRRVVQVVALRGFGDLNG
jgi:hypothetical protein